MNSDNYSTTNNKGLMNSDVFYSIAFALYFAAQFISRTSIESCLGLPSDDFGDLLRLVALLSLLTKTLFERASVRQWALVAVYIVLGFVTWRVSNENKLFWLILFAVTARGVGLKALAQIALAETLAGFVLMLTLLWSGAFSDVAFERDGVVRHALGFVHPNSVGLYLLILCLSFSTIRFEKNPVPDIALLLICAVVNVVVADSRSTTALFFVQALLLILFYVLRSNGLRTRCLKVATLVCVSTVVASILLMFVYSPDNGFLAGLNTMLSNRLGLSCAYYDMSGLSLLGDDFADYPIIYWDSRGPQNFVVDNAYCHLLLRYGLISFGLFLIAYMSLLWLVAKNCKWDALSFGLILMAIYGFVEVLGIMPEANYFFLVGIGSMLELKDVSLSSRGDFAGSGRLNGAL